MGMYFALLQQIREEAPAFLQELLQFGLFLAHPEGFEPPTLWFEVKFIVFWLSQVDHSPEIDRNLGSP